MAPLTRRSRRVAGLDPSSTTPPAPAPAPTPKKHAFRRTSARAENTPMRVVTTKKRTIEAVPQIRDSPSKRLRPSTSVRPAAVSRPEAPRRPSTPERPVEVSPPKATMEMPTTTTQPESFSSTFRAPSPNNPADWSSDDDEDMDDEYTMKTRPNEKDGRMPSIAAQNTPTVFHNSFRAPSPNNPDDWSSDDGMTDDEPAVVSETEAHDELLSTPCPKTGAKKFSRSRSGSLKEGNTTTMQGQSIFEKTAAHTTTNTMTSGDDNATPAPNKEAQTPELASPQVTYLQRTPAPLKSYLSNGRREMSVAKNLMHSNFIKYIEGEGINFKIPTNQQIVDDFNKRAPMINEAGEEVEGLELEIDKLARMGSFDEELKEFDLKAIRERAEDEMDIDTRMVEEDVEMNMNVDKDEWDFALEELKKSEMWAIVDAIPEEEFEGL